jgi:hypothetical protein
VLPQICGLHSTSFLLEITFLWFVVLEQICSVNFFKKCRYVVLVWLCTETRTHIWSIFPSMMFWHLHCQCILPTQHLRNQPEVLVQALWHVESQFLKWKDWFLCQLQIIFPTIYVLYDLRLSQQWLWRMSSSGMWRCVDPRRRHSSYLCVA